MNCFSIFLANSFVEINMFMSIPQRPRQLKRHHARQEWSSSVPGPIIKKKKFKLPPYLKFLRALWSFK